MIDIEQSKLAPVIMGELRARLERLRQADNFGSDLLHKINRVLIETRQRCASQGIDFPVMCAIILPSLHLFEIVRADLDNTGIEQVIINLITINPNLNMAELARAVKTAFPDFRPRRIQ